ncbi:IS66 family insertion sequence element accessory protein TnpB [Bradyrhizobium sp. 15]|uniref:IS66 family insertion sequence element accessory protein TnpB n=1 Tax=Bradyrhizobium sp. 15 TaxID=2782633 RepID=UPI00320ACED6
MIPIAAGARIWIATGHTDMRKGMQGLALLVQEGFGRDPFAGDVFVFRGRAGTLIKALWHDGIGLSLYAKRLDRGRFIWPSAVDGVVALTAAQLGYLGSDRLAQSATQLASAERWIGCAKILLDCKKPAPNRSFYDSIEAWETASKSCRTTLKRCTRRCLRRAPNSPSCAPSSPTTRR